MEACKPNTSAMRTRQIGELFSCVSVSIFSLSCGILFGVCFMFCNYVFWRYMIIFLWLIYSITVFLTHGLSSYYFSCFLLTVNDVLGSVLDLDEGFVSLACCTACSSFFLILPFAITIPPLTKLLIAFPFKIKKILHENSCLYQQYRV